MKADLTRNTYDPKNHFRQVLAQQGRVQLDADHNEQSSLTARLQETTVEDLVGDCGGPADRAAFGMSASAGHADDFLLSAGRYYVDGIQCELENPVSYRAQPDLPNLPPVPAGSHLVYLDVWQRHLTFLDDSRLLETALGGVDTTTRVKNVWQARTLPVTGTPDCRGNYANFTELTQASTIRMQARTQPVAGLNDPCQMAEGSGYKSLENQLYRVEIHSLAPADQTKGVGRAGVWKWSRENGSVEVALNAVDLVQKRITVDSLGRDEKLGIRKGDFVEITDDLLELSGRPGDLIEVDDVDEGGLTITLKTAPVILTAVTASRHPRVRRWDGTANVQAPWLDLEAGIQVKFADTLIARPGDYWQIPARTSAPGAQAGAIEWPQTVPNTPDSLLPRGIVHHFCRLGFVVVSAGDPVFTDCRCLWPTLTGVPRLFYLGGDGQEVRPTGPLNKLPQPLIVGIANSHCAEGPRDVRFTVITGNGQVAAGGSPPAPASVIIPIDALGQAVCDFHLDATNYSQQVRAELLDSNGQPVRPAIMFNATLSIASEVAYDPGKCKGLAEVRTVQDAISTLAAAARVSQIGGDGQDGFSGEILPLSLRVAVMSTCGPVQDAVVIFRGREITGPAAKHSQGNFALKRTDPFVPEVKAITDSNGIAEAFWQLPKPALESTFEAIAQVSDFAGHPPEGPMEVCFTANLRTSNTAQVEDSGAVHIVRTRILADASGDQRKMLTNGDTLESRLLSAGIAIDLDGPLTASSVTTLHSKDGVNVLGAPSNPSCFLVCELPWPLLPSEMDDVRRLDLNAEILGFRPFIVRSEVKFRRGDTDLSAVGTPSIEILPYQASLKFLDRYFEFMKAAEIPLRLLMRLTLKGNFIWRETSAADLKKTGPSGWLDGDSWAVTAAQHPSAMQSMIDPDLASGDGRRGGDFEMWFWLAPEKLS